MNTESFSATGFCDVGSVWIECCRSVVQYQIFALPSRQAHLYIIKSFFLMILIPLTAVLLPVMSCIAKEH